MKKFYKNLTLRIITALMVISIPFLGSSCEDIIINNTGDITGTWTLIYNEGTTLDICPGEKVYFPNAGGGTATLTCPSQVSITRNYTISGTTLTYTETGIEYAISFTQNNELVLSGINNNRILYYSKQVADTKITEHDEAAKNSVSNSSETK